MYRRRTALNRNTDRYYKSIELKSGDTLWDIAETYAAACGLSIPEYVQELKASMGLRGTLSMTDITSPLCTVTMCTDNCVKIII